MYWGCAGRSLDGDVRLLIQQPRELFANWGHDDGEELVDLLRSATDLSDWVETGWDIHFRESRISLQSGDERILAAGFEFRRGGLTVQTNRLVDRLPVAAFRDRGHEKLFGGHVG